MPISGADAAQLRSTAQQFDSAAESLTASLKTLSNLVAQGTQWRGPDADRFRSEWNAVSTATLNSAAVALREGSKCLRRNADEQERASGVSSAGGSPVLECRPGDSRPAPTGLAGLWTEVGAISNEDGSAGYRVQEVVGTDGVTRYIVYIAGTDAADGQTLASNVPAAMGIPDADQLKALKRMIPDGAEVMLVGYSQGGMDAQNIAMQQDNGFKVTQIVTFGSPARADLDVPAVHLQAKGDHIPTTTLGSPGPYFQNSTGSNPDAHIYHGQSNVTGNGYTIHEKAYGNLSGNWDKADFTRGAKNLGDFTGTAVSTRDLDVDGRIL
ncbi:MAG: hypothetical protein AB1925_04080 [Actinomycetota bacterium]